MERTVVHLITGLSKGGAETMLYQLLRYQENHDFQYKVISMGGGHYYEEPLHELGINVVELDFISHPLSSFWHICREIKNADLLCCWMYHANFVGFLAARLCRVKRIVWCIRQSNLSSSVNKNRTLKINRICAQWSKNVSEILYNGNRARDAHEAMGYCRDKGFVVDNGCDCDEYIPDASAPESIRSELNIPYERRIILSVTKDAPVKDIPTFINSFGLTHEQDKGLTAVMCGPGVEVGNERISSLCREKNLEIGKDVFLLGMRHDVPKLLAACDLYVLHSAGEAFPNVLLQAMSCGCLCVTTDVGDARRILNQDDCVVPPGDATLLAEKMAELLALPKERADTMRHENRARVQERFDIREIVKQYEEQF
ncbi:MAG: glycosyltransferase [Clostridium lundense]|nr:glycosyltransferase [Clostridium lundense]